MGNPDDPAAGMRWDAPFDPSELEVVRDAEPELEVSLEAPVELPPPAPFASVDLAALTKALHSFDATFITSYRPSTGEVRLEQDEDGAPIADDDLDPLVIPVEYVGPKSGFLDREDFIALLGHGVVSDRLLEALKDKRAYKAFDDVLADVGEPAQSEWAAFDSARRTCRAVAWLWGYGLISDEDRDAAFAAHADPPVTPSLV